MVVLLLVVLNDREIVIGKIVGAARSKVESRNIKFEIWDARCQVERRKLASR